MQDDTISYNLIGGKDNKANETSDSKRAIERERERESDCESFRNRKPYLMKADGLESTPTPLPAASESEEYRAQPDDVSSVMCLPSVTVRSSGIRRSSLLSMML